MGKCPHCDYEGEAEIEWIDRPDEFLPNGDSGNEYFTGQMVCSSCDAILGGVHSQTVWKSVPCHY